LVKLLNKRKLSWITSPPKALEIWGLRLFGQLKTNSTEHFNTKMKFKTNLRMTYYNHIYKQVDFHLTSRKGKLYSFATKKFSLTIAIHVKA